MKTTTSFLVLILVILVILVGCKNDKTINNSNEQSKKFWVDSIAGYYIVYGYSNSYGARYYDSLGKFHSNSSNDTILDIIRVTVLSSIASIQVDFFKNDSFSTRAHFGFEEPTDTDAVYGGIGRTDIEDYSTIHFRKYVQDSIYFERQCRIGRTGEGGFWHTSLRGVKIK